MTLEQLIRIRCDKYTERADRNKTLFETSDNLANRIRYAVRSNVYRLIAHDLLTALRDAEDIKNG